MGGITHNIDVCVTRIGRVNTPTIRCGPRGRPRPSPGPHGDHWTFLENPMSGRTRSEGNNQTCSFLVSEPSDIGTTQGKPAKCSHPPPIKPGR